MPDFFDDKQSTKGPKCSLGEEVLIRLKLNLEAILAFPGGEPEEMLLQMKSGQLGDFFFSLIVFHFCESINLNYLKINLQLRLELSQSHIMVASKEASLTHTATT